MRTLTVSLLGVAAVAASLVLLRQQRQEAPRQQQPRLVPAGETVPGTISLEKLRESGF